MGKFLTSERHEQIESRLREVSLARRALHLSKFEVTDMSEADKRIYLNNAEMRFGDAMNDLQRNAERDLRDLLAHIEAQDTLIENIQEMIDENDYQ